MWQEKLALELAGDLRRWRVRRRSSQRVLAGFAGVNPSVVARAERGQGAPLSTWEKLFAALGCRLVITVKESEGAEDCEDYLLHETDRRRWRRLDAL